MVGFLILVTLDMEECQCCRCASLGVECQCRIHIIVICHRVVWANDGGGHFLCGVRYNSNIVTVAVDRGILEVRGVEALNIMGQED